MSLICYKPFNANEVAQLEKEKKEKGKYLSYLDSVTDY